MRLIALERAEKLFSEDACLFAAHTTTMAWRSERSGLSSAEAANCPNLRLAPE